MKILAHLKAGFYVYGQAAAAFLMYTMSRPWWHPLWVFIRCLFVSVVTFTVTIIKIIIKVRSRQIILSIASFLKFANGVLLGFIHLEFLTVNSIDIDEETMSYQYTMVV